MSAGSGEGGAAGRSFCIVVSRFNLMVTERLRDGAREALLEAGASPGDVEVVSVPGAWELPWAVRRVAEAMSHDGIVALGCVVRGETPHFEYICRAATDGLRSVAERGEVPVSFGLLTCDTLEQAMERAGGSAGHKGREAAEAVVELCSLAERMG